MNKYRATDLLAIVQLIDQALRYKGRGLPRLSRFWRRGAIASAIPSPQTSIQSIKTNLREGQRRRGHISTIFSPQGRNDGVT